LLLLPKPDFECMLREIQPVNTISHIPEFLIVLLGYPYAIFTK